MKVWLYKMCPRCAGDITVDGEGFGRKVTCIQCGYEECEGQQYRRPEVPQLILPRIDPRSFTDGVPDSRTALLSGRT